MCTYSEWSAWVLPCGERGYTWHMNDGSNDINWRDVRPFWRTRRKMMGSQTGRIKVLNTLDPCSRNTQPNALGQGLHRWSSLLRRKWGGCGKQAQERWAAQLRGIFRQKTVWFLVLPAEFTILRQKIELSHKTMALLFMQFSTVYQRLSNHLLLRAL